MSVRHHDSGHDKGHQRQQGCNSPGKGDQRPLVGQKGATERRCHFVLGRTVATDIDVCCCCCCYVESGEATGNIERSAAVALVAISMVISEVDGTVDSLQYI